ncbi:hypothetical protein [Wolbachia endosymbiont of Pentidionis agamae]|uniref:hypothetical protein n=1 Tax=Wolbachia endosymbiont of Pentidionis agamae TaxID=3110435 RepID=UPI002FD49AC8
MKQETKETLLFLGIGATVGATVGVLTALGLSFTALPALAVGAIIGAIPIALFCAFIYNNCKCGESWTNHIYYSTASLLASSAIGAGLALAATAVFPGVLLGTGSSLLAGAVIGAVAPILGAIAADLAIELAEGVNNHVKSPVVKKCFSSNERVA